MRRVHAAALGICATATAPQDAAFLLEQLQGPSHRGSRDSITSHEVRLARQRTRRFEFTVGQLLRKNAVELQITRDARIGSAGENASTSTHGSHGWGICA